MQKEESLKRRKGAELGCSNAAYVAPFLAKTETVAQRRSFTRVVVVARLQRWTRLKWKVFAYMQTYRWLDMATFVSRRQMLEVAGDRLCGADDKLKNIK